VVPAIGNFLLHVTFPNVYVLNPTLPNEKKEDETIKQSISTPEFSNGMLWHIFDEFLAFTKSGKSFEATKDITDDTEMANEAEGHDIIQSLKSCEELEFLHENPTEDECFEGGYVISPTKLKEVIKKHKNRGNLAGVTASGVISNLKSKGYYKTETKKSFDAGLGDGLQLLNWIIGIKKIE